MNPQCLRHFQSDHSLKASNECNIDLNTSNKENTPVLVLSFKHQIFFCNEYNLPIITLHEICNQRQDEPENEEKAVYIEVELIDNQFYLNSNCEHLSFSYKNNHQISIKSKRIPVNGEGYIKTCTLNPEKKILIRFKVI